MNNQPPITFRYHMTMIALDPPGASDRRWTCKFEGCTTPGDIDILMKHQCIAPDGDPCSWCGWIRECAPDCAGMELLLGRSDIHVVGEQPKWKALGEPA